MLLGKINKFLFLFMLGKTGQEKEFCNFLDRKLAFLDYKNNDLKKSKNWHFSKGVSPWCWRKFWNLFISSFYWRYVKNVIGNVLDRKLAFLDYKNNELKNSKNLHFSKRVSPWFRPKLWKLLISSFQVRYAKKSVW